MYFYTSRYI